MVGGSETRPYETKDDTLFARYKRDFLIHIFLIYGLGLGSLIDQLQVKMPYLGPIG